MVELPSSIPYTYSNQIVTSSDTLQSIPTPHKSSKKQPAKENRLNGQLSRYLHDTNASISFEAIQTILNPWSIIGEQNKRGGVNVFLSRS
jgi:hypothetical protein